MESTEFRSVGSLGVPITVRVPPEVAFDLEKAQRVQASILKRLGCQTCCSGFDIRFRLEEEFIADAKLNVRSLGELGA